jgi:hypothetical protein
MAQEGLMARDLANDVLRGSWMLVAAFDAEPHAEPVVRGRAAAFSH